MHPFDMQWPEEEELQALLRLVSSRISGGQGSLALVRLSRRRAGLMRACPVGSLLWRVLRGWPARPAVGHILVRALVGTFSAARDALETLMRVYPPRLPPTRHKRADQMGARSYVVSVRPSRSDAKRAKRSSTAGTCVQRL